VHHCGIASRGFWRSVVLAAGLAATMVLGVVSTAFAEATLLMDANTGKVLQAENATYPWYPASLTKLMTAYITLKAVKEGRLSLDTPFTVSATALAQPPTKMGFKVGTVVTVDNALKMMLVKSANDMAVLLAEGQAGSVEAFADVMNATAAHLGMTQSHFVNPNGLPADGHVSSARDLGILARAIFQDLPEYSYYWHLPGIRFGRRVVRNYNKLIDLYPGADGMKTGFICASGFNLIASATRDNRHLIAIVLGAPSSSARAFKAATMLEQGFTDKGLAWLMPSLGTVNDLKPMDVPPPDLRDEMCGPHRRRPAEDEEVDTSALASDPNSPLAYVLSNLHNPVRTSQVLNGLASLPPVEVFVGAFKPSSAQAMEAQENQLAGGGPARRKVAKAKGKKGVQSASAEEAAGKDKKAAAGDRPAKADDRKDGDGSKSASKKSERKKADGKKAESKPAVIDAEKTAARPARVASPKSQAKPVVLAPGGQ